MKRLDVNPHFRDRTEIKSAAMLMQKYGIDYLEPDGNSLCQRGGNCANRAGGNGIMDQYRFRHIAVRKTVGDGCGFTILGNPLLKIAANAASSPFPA